MPCSHATELVQAEVFFGGGRLVKGGRGKEQPASGDWNIGREERGKRGEREEWTE